MLKACKVLPFNNMTTKGHPFWWAWFNELRFFFVYEYRCKFGCAYKYGVNVADVKKQQRIKNNKKVDLIWIHDNLVCLLLLLVSFLRHRWTFKCIMLMAMDGLDAIRCDLTWATKISSHSSKLAFNNKPINILI